MTINERIANRERIGSASARPSEQVGVNDLQQITRCFTFGFGHRYPNGFVRITAPTYAECRAEMACRYENKWAFDYSEEQIADQVKRFPQMYEVIE